MVELRECRIAGVRADLVKNEVKITIAVGLSDEVRDIAKLKLGWWSVTEIPLDVTMTEWQKQLPGIDEGEE